MASIALKSGVTNRKGAMDGSAGCIERCSPSGKEGWQVNCLLLTAIGNRIMDDLEMLSLANSKDGRFIQSGENPHNGMDEIP